MDSVSGADSEEWRCVWERRGEQGGEKAKALPAR